MKLLFALAAILSLAACATEGPSGPEVQDQLRRGASGEGRLGSIDRTDDPYVHARGSGSTHP